MHRVYRHNIILNIVYFSASYIIRRGKRERTTLKCVRSCFVIVGNKAIDAGLIKKKEYSTTTRKGRPLTFFFHLNYYKVIIFFYYRQNNNTAKYKLYFWFDFDKTKLNQPLSTASLIKCTYFICSLVPRVLRSW